MLNISNRDEMDIGVGTTAKTTSAPRIDPLEALRKVQNTIQSEEISLLKVAPHNTLSKARSVETPKPSPRQHARSPLISNLRPTLRL